MLSRISYAFVNSQGQAMAGQLVFVTSNLSNTAINLYSESGLPLGTNVGTTNDVGEFVAYVPFGKQVSLSLRDSTTGFLYEVANDVTPTQTGIQLSKVAKGSESLTLACSDLVTALSIKPIAAYTRVLKPMRLVDVRASLLVASASGNVRIDVKKNGVSILETPIVINSGTKTSFGVSPAQFLSDADSMVLADNDELIVEIVAPGVGAKGLLVSFIGNAE